MTSYKIVLEALRPAQWIKNVSIFAAPMLTGKLFDPTVTLLASNAFVVFCFLSSSSYLINDILDAPKDKLHPFKRLRPIARGALDKKTAFMVAIFLLISGLFIASTVNSNFLFISIVFIVLQYLYSLVLKRKAIFDILGIALFFIIRAYAGELATGWHLPVWIMLTVIFLSLFIASGKRRSELLRSGTTTRAALSEYGTSLLNFYTTMFAVATLICYAMFTYFVQEKIQFDGLLHEFIIKYFPNWLDRKWYMVTLIPIIVGIMRYGQIIFQMEEAERPEKILASDIPLIVAIFSWGAMMLAIIYVL